MVLSIRQATGKPLNIVCCLSHENHEGQRNDEYYNLASPEVISTDLMTYMILTHLNFITWTRNIDFQPNAKTVVIYFLLRSRMGGDP